MGLETIGIALSIGSAVFGVVNGIAQMSRANQTYDVQQQAANANLQNQYQEIARQQQEVVETATEQRSDRVRQATRELSTLRVAAGEMGTSGGTFASMVYEIGAFEGLDISRITANERRNLERGEAEKRAAQQGYINTINIAENQRVAGQAEGASNAFGSALRIGTSLYDRYERNQQRTQDREFYRDLGANRVR